MESNQNPKKLLGNVLETPAYAISKQPVVIDQEQHITKALSLFDKGLRSLIVVDSENNAVGFLESKNVLKSKIQPTAKVKTFIKPLVKTQPKASIVELAMEMLNSNVKVLLVHGQNKGSDIRVVTEEEVLKSAEDFFKTIKLSDVMIRGVVVEKPSTPIGVVINLMRERNIAHIPIVEDSKIVGIVSAKDIVESLNHPERRQRLGDLAGEKEHLLKLPVKAIMSKNLHVLKPDDNVALAMNTMVSNNISSVIITDSSRLNKDILLGIITRHDLLALIASQGLKQESVITLLGDIKKLDAFEKRFMEKELHRFMVKAKKIFVNSKIVAHLKALKYRADKNAQLVSIRLKLYTNAGLLVVHHEGFGALTTLQSALDKLSTKLKKQKELLDKDWKH